MAHLSDPYSLKGVKEARQLILASKGMTGAIIGDYDCDGVCSSAIASFLLKDMGIGNDLFLPHRMFHGYGLNDKTVASFMEKHAASPPEFVLVVDCGSSSESAVIALRNFGVKRIVIVDHHIIDPAKEAKSADVLINWRNCGFNEQCAAGEMFTLARTFFGGMALAGLLPYAAVGTVADMVPIWGDNRILVKNGLSPDGFAVARAPGLKILASAFIYGQKRLEGVSQESISFSVAPKINAVGRLETAYTAHETIMEPDRTMAFIKANHLNEKNKERQSLEFEIVSQVMEQVAAMPVVPEHGLLVHGDWHIGVVGIVASRLVEKFKRPCFVFGQNNGIVKGSGRSIEGINLKAVMDDVADMFEAYGGHEMAAGATLKDAAVETAAKRFNEACKAHWEAGAVREPVRWYDAEVMPSEIGSGLTDLIRQTMYPFCRKNNPEPVFRVRAENISDVEQRDGKRRRLSFYCRDVMSQFVLFSNDWTEEMLAGKNAMVYFSVPQDVSYEFEPPLRVLDLEILA